MGQLSHTVRTPQPRDCGFLFNFWVWSGEGGAQLLAWRPDCMGFAMQVTTEWKRVHIWDILATFQPHSLGTGDKQTAYAREIPGRVKGNRQYSRSFVYCRKLACSTISLTGDRVRGDDSKEYRYYKSKYSTVQGFFQQPAQPPGRTVLSPLQSRSAVHREPSRIRRGPASEY